MLNYQKMKANKNLKILKKKVLKKKILIYSLCLKEQKKFHLKKIIIVKIHKLILWIIFDFKLIN